MGNRVLMKTKNRVGKWVDKGLVTCGKGVFSISYQCFINAFINAVFGRNTRLSIYPRFDNRKGRKQQKITGGLIDVG